MFPLLVLSGITLIHRSPSRLRPSSRPTAIFKCFKPRDNNISQFFVDNITRTVRDGVLFQHFLADTREKQRHAVMRSQMNNLREQQQKCIIILKQVAMQPQNQPRPVSAPPAANMALPPFPWRCPSDMGLGTRCRQRMPMLSIRTETRDRLQDINEEPRRCIGPSHVKELAKSFTPSSDEEEHTHVNIRTRWKRLFEPKEKEGRSSEKW